MQPHFDSIAASYDVAFTHTIVGKAQRAVVWKHLNKAIGTKPLSILELNCGTGEDAVMLAAKGHHVTATDISTGMLAVAERKATGKALTIHTKQWDLSEPFPNLGQQYELIFSNFGGLNCIPPEKLHALFATLNNVLAPGGQCIFVVMGNYCIMESAYFLCTFQFSKIFRRKRMQNVPIGNNITVPTWYYSPTALQRAAQKKLEKEKRLSDWLIYSAFIHERIF